MFAHLADFFPELKEIGKNLRFLGGRAQQGGGMEGAHHKDALLLKKLPVLAGDLKIGGDEAAGRHPPEADEDFRAQEGHLPFQPADAGLLLLRRGIPVLGRAAFDHVGDVDVLFPREANGRQHLVEKLARPPDKGLPLLVLVGARPLSDKEDFGGGVPRPEHHMLARRREGAGRAGTARLLQRLPIGIRHPVHPFRARSRPPRSIRFLS